MEVVDGEAVEDEGKGEKGGNGRPVEKTRQQNQTLLCVCVADERARRQEDKSCRFCVVCTSKLTEETKQPGKDKGWVDALLRSPYSTIEWEK